MDRERRLAGRRVRRRRRIAARLDAFAEAAGVPLLPWQREWAVSILDGDMVVLVGGRRGGRAVTLRTVQDYREGGVNGGG